MEKKLLLLLTIALFCSCSKNTDTDDEGVPLPDLQHKYIDNSALFVGKWQLDTAIIGIFPLDSLGLIAYDYIKDSIVYEFKPDHVVSISGKTDHIDLYKIPEFGVYTYSSTAPVSSSGFENTTMFIDNIRYYCFTYMLKIHLLSITSSDYRIYQLVKIE